MSGKRPAVFIATALLALTGFTTSAFAGHYLGYGAGDRPYGHHHHHGYGYYGHAERKPLKLGVKITEVSQAELNELGLEYGLRIKAVKPGSVAAVSGLQSGDVITSIGDRPAYSIKRLQYLLKEAQGATKVALSRGGEKLQVDAEFAKAKAGRAMLGVRVQQMTEDLKQAFGTDGQSGVLISQVTDDSAASKAGLKAGDVIIALGGNPVGKVKDVYRLIGSQAPGDALDVALVRDREELTMQVELGAAPVIGQAGKSHSHGMHRYHHRWHHGGMPGKHCGPKKRAYRS